jgi:spore coat protein CotF
MFELYARDEDLRLILKYGKNTLGKHIDILEKKMTEFAIPLPLRPPKQTQNTVNLEVTSDRYIFRRVLRGIQSFLPTHSMAVIHSTSPVIRDLFLSFLNEEMKLYDKLVEYGKLKGYILEPPVYKV